MHAPQLEVGQFSPSRCPAAVRNDERFAAPWPRSSAQPSRKQAEEERMSAQPKDEVTVTTAIAEYNPIAAVLADLTKRHKGVVFDVTQPSA
jgi:hypothetical protein